MTNRLIWLVALVLAIWASVTYGQILTATAVGVPVQPVASLAAAVYTPPNSLVAVRYANLASVRLYWTGYCWGWWGYNGGCCGCNGGWWGGWGYGWRYGCYYPYYLAVAATSTNAKKAEDVPAFSVTPTSPPPTAPPDLEPNPAPANRDVSAATIAASVYVHADTRVAVKYANLAISRLYWTGYCWGWWGYGGWGGSGCCNGWGTWGGWRYGCYYPYYLRLAAPAVAGVAAADIAPAYSLAPTTAPPPAPAEIDPYPKAG